MRLTARRLKTSLRAGVSWQRAIRIVAIRTSCACVASYRGEARARSFSAICPGSPVCKKVFGARLYRRTVVGMSPWALMNCNGQTAAPFRKDDPAIATHSKPSICKSSNKQAGPLLNGRGEKFCGCLCAKETS